MTKQILRNFHCEVINILEKLHKNCFQWLNNREKNYKIDKKYSKYEKNC